jgi:hypothetical protein
LALGAPGAGAPEAAAKEHATATLGPTGIVEHISIVQKFQVVGSNGEVDISEKENKDSLNMTWQEIMILLE